MSEVIKYDKIKVVLRFRKFLDEHTVKYIGVYIKQYSSLKAKKENQLFQHYSESLSCVHHFLALESLRSLACPWLCPLTLIALSACPAGTVFLTRIFLAMTCSSSDESEEMLD